MEQKQNWLERPTHPAFPSITNEIAIFAGIILLAIATRFYMLEPRVMSHDESLHTYFSWLLYRGQGYQHSPMMHGPFQFHIVALTYFLFGANDFTSRIPTALFSIGIVAMVWYWRRYLGKWGALITGFLLVISPYMLYYGRYVRNESFVGFSGLLMLYAVLRHLEVGGKKYLYLLAASLALHFTSKETSYIYVAELLIYLAIYFFAKTTRHPWRENLADYRAFVISMSVAVLLAGATVGYALYLRDPAAFSQTETAMPSDPLAGASPEIAAAAGTSPVVIILAIVTIFAFVAAAFFMIRGYTWQRLRTERSFDLLMVTGTIVLPLLAPLPISIVEKQYGLVIPTTFEEIQSLTGTAMWIIGIFLIAMFALAIVIGLLWNREMFLKTAAIFWLPYTVLYTTVFTNSAGFFTGTIGSLGYWIVQQDVNRGSQPWYFYVLIQVPIYEFLPAIGFFLALIIGIPRLMRASKVAAYDNNEVEYSKSEVEESEVIRMLEETPEQSNFFNTYTLLVYWSIMSTFAFTFAGERMPWLTLHITLPLILITGWALGQIIENTDWESLRSKHAPITLAVIAIFVTSVAAMLIALFGPTPPFQGKELVQLQATSAFILPAVVAILSAATVVYMLRDWTFSLINRVVVLTAFAFLALLTTRAAFRASYITYDQATEFLVYAHGATGIKEIINEAKEVSERTTGGMGISLAYDASAPDTGVSWPFVWYLRDFTNQHAFDQPTRSLRDSTIIIVDQKNFDKIEPAIGPGYYRVDYIRMWWPMQDYFNLVSDRDASQPFPEDYKCSGAMSFLKLRKSKDYSKFCEGFTDPAIRAGIFQIWLNRDYTLYSQAKGRTDLTVATWEPANKMRMYIKSDVASQIWNYGVTSGLTETQVDPTEGKFISLPADLQVPVSNAIPLNAPRSLAFAQDGTFYVADSRNHRILHLDTNGNTLQEWGSFADVQVTPESNGLLNEPWGVAVGPDGSVYVTDVWNHRIQKFTAEGRFLKTWGFFGQGDTPDALYGPRGIAVDSEGRVYVADTGNKRIVVFDSNGNGLTEFGGAGFDPGQFDEPVGVTVDRNGTVYVVDAWNQRIQTFRPQEIDGVLSFTPEKQWDVYGWFGQSLENKPFIAVNDQLHVFITDPEGYRVIEYDQDGTLIRTWGEYGDQAAQFGLASGIAVDPEGHIWVTDGAFHRILRFTLP